ncbi:MAG: pyruvate dehydrogenase (acetyl-transferring), homodimeric type [Gammaproteobacteria bacterium]|nr:pyruvate dehydrogenase (acetyl-transferring), homodimeric type [Gammaproteobacteria bacterium]
MSRFNPFDDIDPIETSEWLESIDSVLGQHGPERAHFLLNKMIDFARRSGAYLPYSPNTAYLNTIATGRQPEYPGDRSLERRIEAYLRWNAMAMVVQANRKSTEYGGHISSYASCATMYEVGFNHFWRGPTEEHGGDMVFIQGHSSPGIYARAYLEGRLNENDLNRFRREVGGGGLSSYPHPWLMPDFWQFPTVSMGLGPMMAIYQARFMRYMQNREMVAPSDRKVWAFLGDGEMDEPESMGAITMPVREGLDNLVFVVNCNLQRLDGPVRGNGKIIQELEAAFGGAGWNVIKVIWGGRWDPLLARDQNGHLRRIMEETVDGEYQNYKSKDGAYVREQFFAKHPETAEMVANMPDEQIWRLNRGGHDPIKMYAAYDAAVRHTGQPTIILAKTVKGFGMGGAGEGQNTAHQQKKLDLEALKQMRDRFNIPVSDKDIESVPYYKPAADSAELEYLLERRQALGGHVPQRRKRAASLRVPELEMFKTQLDGTGEREASTTMAFVRMLTALARDKQIGKHIVPIVPDEARTFGMEGMFRQFGIYASKGQLYEPEDAGELMYYREDKKGVILEEGINEAGAFCSWLAAGTAYSNHNTQMVPFYIYYSMFGFQRIGDFIWAGGDMQSRGFLIGATAGRTTLAGEGLQHQDGHSLVNASTVPNCVSYDPTYAYELAVIIQDGLRRMIGEQENVFYYITCMNENYVHPPMPKGVEEGILKGMYLLQVGGQGKIRAQLMGSGTILREVLGAAELLIKDFGIPTDVWSVTSFNELRRDGLEVERWNQLHPEAEPRQSYVAQCLAGRPGPYIAATDYMKIVPDQIQRWVPGSFISLGTDGYGRSDARAALRRHFEVDKRFIAVAALKALADDGVLDQKTVSQAIEKYGIDPDRPDPVTL